MFSMWLAEDVVVGRKEQLTKAEKAMLSRYALCGKHATGRRNGPPLFECTTDSVVKLRRKVEGVVEKN